MTFYANDVHPVPPDHCAPDCDDQLPLISHVGRGIAGDDARVLIADPDTTSETHLVGGYYDNADKTFHTDWVSENINGGELSYQYNLRPYTIPRTFTITFIYRRPGRPEWSWTTPAIPYIWTLDPAGDLDDDPDHIVGSGVATLFVKTMHTPWKEKLRYPAGTTREDFNAPNVGEAWVAEITFGRGGDVDVPDFDDLAKLIGISKQDVYDILADKSVTINGIDARNLVQYIDKCDARDKKAVLDHVHADLGFNSTGHAATGAFGGKNTVKAYIDDKIADAVENLTNQLNDLSTNLTNLINKNKGISDKTDADIVSKFYLGGTIDPTTGKVTWPTDDKAAIGNMNWYSGSNNANYIKTAADGDGDMRAQ